MLLLVDLVHVIGWQGTCMVNGLRLFDLGTTCKRICEGEGLLRATEGYEYCTHLPRSSSTIDELLELMNGSV
jgi:hypothetical protein